MASNIPQEAVREINETVGVMQSARVLIDKIKDIMQAAIDQALQNGATAEELQPVSDAVVALDRESTQLAQAVANHPLPSEGGPPPSAAPRRA